MGFEEFLEARGENGLLKIIQNFEGEQIPDLFHEKLLIQCRDFSWVGGMPEVVQKYASGESLVSCEKAQRSILTTYRDNFSKYRNQLPLARLDKLFDAIPLQVGKKWVHARIDPEERAKATDAALDALCQARVTSRVYHSSGNGIPLAAEKNTRAFKVLFLDVGLMANRLGLRLSDLIDSSEFARVNEGALAEQWVGQHLLNIRPESDPEVFYWVREKTGSIDEIDYLLANGPNVVPIEVKAGALSRAKFLTVFLKEKKKSIVGVKISSSKYFRSRETRVF